MSNEEKENKQRAETDNLELELIDISTIEINKIVSAGIKEEKTLNRYLIDMIKDIGLENIFHDKTELTFISILVMASLVFLMAGVRDNSIYNEKIYRYIFIMSPILYLIVLLFSFFNIKQKGTFELEMTCKYNIYQMLVIRMFIFSIITILVNTCIIIWVFIYKNNIDILRAICISITGGFLFSASFLCITMKSKKGWFKFIFIAFWIIVNIAFYHLNKELYNGFLIRTPIYIHLIVTILCCISYIKNLKKLMSFRREKGVF